MLSRSGCWRGATWQRGRPRPRAGWRRRLATSLCALLRASCAALGPSRALAHNCRSAELLASHFSPCQNVFCSSQIGLQSMAPASSEKHSASFRAAHGKLWNLSGILLRHPAESKAHSAGGRAAAARRCAGDCSCLAGGSRGDLQLHGGCSAAGAGGRQHSGFRHCRTQVSIHQHP